MVRTNSSQELFHQDFLMECEPEGLRVLVYGVHLHGFEDECGRMSRRISAEDVHVSCTFKDSSMQTCKHFCMSGHGFLDRGMPSLPRTYTC